MNRLKRIGILVLGLTAMTFAEGNWPGDFRHRQAPEIDAGAAATALAFVSSAVLIIRSRRRKT